MAYKKGYPRRYLRKQSPFRQSFARLPVRIVSGLVLVLALLIFTSCSSQKDITGEIRFVRVQETTETLIKPEQQGVAEQMPIFVPKELEAACMTIANAYRDLIMDAPEITNTTIEAIEARLIVAGYPIVVQEDPYPEYLANSQRLYDFWDRVSSKEDGEIGILWIREGGGFLYLYFCSVEGQGQSFLAVVDWGADREPYISMCEQHPVYDWELTENGTFYYQIYPGDCHYDDYARLLLHPVNAEYYDFVLSYIKPIGYYQNNMFYCNWSEPDFGSLCFNDLFGHLYLMCNGNKLNPNEFSYNKAPMYFLIPADLFEETVLSFFSITPAELQSRAVYFDDRQEYAYADNYPYYPDDIPDMRPMVTAKTDNPDGTFTILVTVSSLEMKTDNLFSHEVTIRPLENGGFQYVSNKITYLTSYGLPPNFPRLPAEIRK